MAEPDIIGALRHLVAIDPETVLVAGDNVFGGELPPGFEMPQRAILITASGGPAVGYGRAALDMQRVDVIGYGVTPADADLARRTACQRMWNIDREVALGVLVHEASNAGGFSQARDRDGHWPQSFRSFSVLYSLQEVQ